MKIQIYRAAIPFVIMLCSCSAPRKNRGDLAAIEQEIIAVEKSFSDYSEKNGFAKALAEYAADDVIKLNKIIRIVCRYCQSRNALLMRHVFQQVL